MTNPRLDSIILETKQIMKSCIEKIKDLIHQEKPILSRPILSRSDITKRVEEEYNSFGDYYKGIYKKVSERFSKRAAKKFQREMLVYHYNLTRNPGFEGTLKYLIGRGISWKKYKKIIKKAYLKENFAY